MEKVRIIVAWMQEAVRPTMFLICVWICIKTIFDGRKSHDRD